MVFVTSKECRDISPSEAKDYILGYTVGNDLSCRLFQLPDNSGGQFFFAKAFDKFAPIGPTLVSPEVYARNPQQRLVTKVNGEVRQNFDLAEDMIFSPERILSHMSQGTNTPRTRSLFSAQTNIPSRYHDPCWHGRDDRYRGWCWSIL